MKTIKYISIRLVAVAAVLFGLSQPMNAQLSMSSYINVDWQFNGSVGTKYMEDASGWGMNFDGGYFLTPNVAVGAFLSYHTNNKYFSRRTLSTSSGTEMNCDQVHQLFQLPFGASVNYRFLYDGVVRPYAALKLGAEYAQLESYFNIYSYTKNTWGFYLSPEVGMEIYPWKGGVGFHFAIYYSYATNRTDDMPGYDVKGLNNLGFRVGLAF